MQQLSLFDTLRSPAIRKPVEPHGGVVQGEPDAVYRLRHPRLAWDRATIELHQHTDGLWMWSASFYCDNSGGGYRVGPKWGRFAETRDDACSTPLPKSRRGSKASQAKTPRSSSHGS